MQTQADPRPAPAAALHSPLGLLAELQHVGRWSPKGVFDVDKRLRSMCHGLYDELRFRIAVRK